jgi:hypothetical protein
MVGGVVLAEDKDPEQARISIQNELDRDIDAFMLARKPPPLFDNASDRPAMHHFRADMARDEFFRPDRGCVKIAEVLATLPLDKVTNAAPTSERERFSERHPTTPVPVQRQNAV